MGLLLILAISSVRAHAHPAGQTLPEAPAALGIVSPGPPSVETLQHLLETGQSIEALRTAEALLIDLPRGRTRDAVQLAAATLHRDAGRHNLASEAFTRVRGRGGPLASIAAWFEAEQDYRRGRLTVAARECEAYRRRWPRGPHASSCLRLVALSLARSGQADEAREVAERYDDDHPRGPIAEQVELAVARHHLETGQTRAAVPILVRLALEHSAPLAGRRAEQWLARLPGGRVALPETPADRTQRAISLRDSGRLDEAWDAFEELAELAADDTAVLAFLTREASRFGWRTRRWSFLDEWYADRYARNPDPRTAWTHYRVLFRAGRPSDAAELGLAMQRRYPGDARWRRSHEDLARTMMLAGRYDDARDQFSAASRRGGATGRRCRFYAAFSTLMAGRHDDAIVQLGEVVEEGPAWRVEARYWRSRASEVVGREADAAADRAWVLTHDPDGWYGVLLRSRHGADAPAARHGRWGLPRPPDRVAVHLVPRPLGPISAGLVPEETARSVEAVGRLSWPFRVAHLHTSPAAPARPRAMEGAPLVAPPRSYVSAGFWDAEAGAEALADFVRRHGRTWPELRAIEDLARVGLYDLSGTLMSDWYERWRRDWRRNRNHARRVRGMRSEDWRTLFLATHDHHHAARFSASIRHDPDDDVRRLAWPIAHGHAIWSAGAAHDVDPLLVLGLVRQESRYDASAVSRAGARGAMQIMPRTGHLLADRLGDDEFTAADLEEPELAIGLGIHYLGLLLDRFDGVFPLAVAAYNAGPFSVSSWLAGTGPHLPLDAFVEHVPFPETRDYVKRVTANYDTYARLYGPAGSAVIVPPHPEGDRAEVVDF